MYGQTDDIPWQYRATHARAACGKNSLNAIFNNDCRQ